MLSRIARQVATVERIKELARKAGTILKELGCTNVVVRYGDGSPDVPKSLRQQLKAGGRLVMPIGKDRQNQVLIRITKKSEDVFASEEIAHVRFVPLIGHEGWLADTVQL